jgi:hypothetical protein
MRQGAGGRSQAHPTLWRALALAWLLCVAGVAGWALTRARPLGVGFTARLQAALVQQVDGARRLAGGRPPLSSTDAEDRAAAALLPVAGNAGVIASPSNAFFVVYQGRALLIPRDAAVIAATMLRELPTPDRRLLQTAVSCAIRVGTNYAGALLAVFVCDAAAWTHPAASARCRAAPPRRGCAPPR